MKFSGQDLTVLQLDCQRRSPWVCSVLTAWLCACSILGATEMFKNWKQFLKDQ